MDNTIATAVAFEGTANRPESSSTTFLIRY